MFRYMVQMDVHISNIEDVDRSDYGMDDHTYWTRMALCDMLDHVEDMIDHGGWIWNYGTIEDLVTARMGSK